jgi:hypothetical protein
MIKSPFYVRVVPQDRGRGYELLGGFEKKLIKSTAHRVITLSVLTRAHLNEVIAQMGREHNSLGDPIDLTPDGVKNQLKKLFNEALTKKSPKSAED